jgi:hypothetical protein
VYSPRDTASLTRRPPQILQCYRKKKKRRLPSRKAYINSRTAVQTLIQTYCCRIAETAGSWVTSRRFAADSTAQLIKTFPSLFLRGFQFLFNLHVLCFSADSLFVLPFFQMAMFPFINSKVHFSSGLCT